MHELLDKQIRRSRAKDGGVDLARLYDYVSAAYQELDQERRRIDRAHWLMTEELDELNRNLENVVNELSTQNLRFEMAIENMSQGLCMVSAGGQVVVVNRRFLEIYGIDADDFRIGMLLQELLACSRKLNPPHGQANPPSSDTLHIVLDGVGRDMRQPLGTEQIVSLTTLPMQDGGHVLTVEDVTERVNAEARISHLAMHDVLTGLPNRLLFQSRLNTAIDTCQHNRQRMALIYIDLDHFKEVNDTLGHDAGDELLKHVVARIRALLAPGDHFARLGGDEFAILRMGVESRKDLSSLARDIIAEVSRPFSINGESVVIGASIGIASGCAADSSDMQKKADLALYSSKHAGRGAYRFFKQQMNVELRNRMALGADLRLAVAEGQFEVYFQPLVATRSGEIASFEALLRWNHPKKGLVLPGEFIQLAEETGEIDAIGEFVLRRACEIIGRHPGLSVAVNVSPVQFRNRKLASVVRRHLDEIGFDPNRLAVEITEQTLLQGNSSVMHTLKQMKDMGISIVMDDFGTGYSSLSYLRQFPFDKIKIDRNFVQDIVSSSKDQAIIDSIVFLGRRLGMTVVAEGIENHEQALMLGAAGCDEMQGYLYGRPVPAKAIDALLEGRRGRNDAPAVPANTASGPGIGARSKIAAGA